MNLSVLIEACQTAVGAYRDGKPGVETWTKIARKLGCYPDESPAAPASRVADPVDGRSEANILTLLPEVRPYARALVHAAADHGITIVVTSALRTYAEQQALYDKHDGTTKAPAGFSNHNFGLAFDVTEFVDGKPRYESPSYKAVAALAQGLGLTWGGNWHSFQDEPHYELRPTWAAALSENDMLAELRRRRMNGEPVFA